MSGSVYDCTRTPGVQIGGSSAFTKEIDCQLGRCHNASACRSQERLEEKRGRACLRHWRIVGRVTCVLKELLRERDGSI